MLSGSTYALSARVRVLARASTQPEQTTVPSPLHMRRVSVVLRCWRSQVRASVYTSAASLLAGQPPDSTFLLPRSLSPLEGTPSVYGWDPAGDTALLGFHFNDPTTGRDQVLCCAVEAGE